MIKINKEATDKLTTEKYGAIPIIISPKVMITRNDKRSTK